MSVKEVMMINSNFHLPLDDLITGRNLGFGDGRHGNVVYDGTFPYFRENRTDRYEIHSTYFEVPAGKTLKPPLESGGLLIYSLSDIVINGTIDMKSRGCYISVKEAPNEITVYGRTFQLPLCGSTVLSAVSGNGGSLSVTSPYKNAAGGKGLSGDTSFLEGTYSAGGYSAPTCGEGGNYRLSSNSANVGIYVKLRDELRRQPTGIVILVARGKIIIKGKIDCSASPGIAAESGQTGYIIDDDSIYRGVYAGRGGGGAQSPSGGGGITLIASKIERSGGVLDVSGKTYVNTTAGTSYLAEYKNMTHPNSSLSFKVYMGGGGTGTPSTGFTSQAGGIKEYIYSKG